MTNERMDEGHRAKCPMCDSDTFTWGIDEYGDWLRCTNCNAIVTTFGNVQTASEKIQEQVKTLAEAHWRFLEDFVRSMTTDSNIARRISDVRYGFLIAFPHGYKHGFKDAERGE